MYCTIFFTFYIKLYFHYIRFLYTYVFADYFTKLSE